MSCASTSNEGKSTPKLDGYKFCEKLGTGSFADVYKAYTNDGKDVVAIKCVDKKQLSKTALDNLISEIKILKDLDHEYIVKLKNFNWDDSYVYIIMEYCSGGSLWHFIHKHKRLPERVCQRFLQQLALAMKYLREKSISHFDLKPQNILIASRKVQVLKIADFGLAQSMSDNDKTTLLKGSPLYMAPEIVLEKQYDARADIWSVGVILYECLFGKAPYSSSSVDELIVKIKKGNKIEIPENSRISPDCLHFLKGCLQRDVEKRLDFHQFFLHSFVDLEHASSPYSLEKATQTLAEAVKCDQQGDYTTAFKLYVEGLQYLVPLTYTEKDSMKRVQIKKRVGEYMRRIEIVKCKRSSTGTNKDLIPLTIPSYVLKMDHNNVTGEKDLSELLSLSKTTPAIESAIDIALSAELYEKELKFELALQKYELALGKLLSLLRNEPKGRRKDLLYEEMNRWMGQAEHLKNLKSDDTLIESSDVDIEKNCIIQ